MTWKVAPCGCELFCDEEGRRLVVRFLCREHVAKRPGFVWIRGMGYAPGMLSRFQCEEAVVATQEQDEDICKLDFGEKA